MNTETVTLQLPASLYADLEELANETHRDPIEIISIWLEESRQRRQWQQGWAELRAQVQENGGFQLGESADEIVVQTRRSREGIFEAEYAHLYR